MPHAANQLKGLYWVCLAIAAPAYLLVQTPHVAHGALVAEWRIVGTAGDWNGEPAIFYSVDNTHFTDSINALAVGFTPSDNADFRWNGAPGWQGVAVDATGWASPQTALGNESAKDFFGLTWSEFQALDPDSPTSWAAIFNRGTTGTDLFPPGSYGVGGTSATATPALAAILSWPGSPAAIRLSNLQVSGGATGEYNAFAAIPEPSSFLFFALVGLSLAGKQLHARVRLTA